MMIEGNRIEKKFGTRRLFHDFSFQIEAGEMVAIVGASGCGKTTLLNILGLIEPLDVGEVRIDGQKAPRPNTRKAQKTIQSTISYLFQNFALIDTKTVEDNLMLAAHGTKPQKRRLVRQALKTVGLERALRQRVYELSGGEQQRVAIARAMLKPGKIVLADEPTGALDPENRTLVLRLLQGMRDAGKTIVIVTHDDYVAKACDRIIRLDVIQ